MVIDNDIKLQEVLLNDLNSIIDEVTEKLLKNLQKSIQKEVYDAGTPIEYERQGMDGGIQGSFETSTAVTMGNFIEAWIEQDPMKMKLDKLNYIHGAYGQVPEDVRSILAELIIEGTSWLRFGYGFWTEPRDFWGPFIEELNKNGNKFIEQAFKKRGIIYNKII